MTRSPFPAALGLTFTEARILMCIMARAPEPIAQADIHGTLHGDVPFDPRGRVIDRQVAYMRKKLVRYGIELRNARGQGYYVTAEDGRALHKWLEQRRRPLPGVHDPIPTSLVITFFGERNRSPRAIEKMLQGEVSLGAVKAVMSRARRQGRDIPTWTGGTANCSAGVEQGR